MELIFDYIIGVGLMIIGVIGMYLMLTKKNVSDNVSEKAARIGFFGLLISLMMLGLYFVL